MQKSINEMAQYIKNILPTNIEETYTVKSMFQKISSEKDIQRGVLAFRDFLYVVCDRMIVDGSIYEKNPKSTNKDIAHPSLPKSYPFLNNVKSILFTIGYCGDLVKDNTVILINNLQDFTKVIGVDGQEMKAKISFPKVMEVLRFLDSCGIRFGGIDLDIQKHNISNIESLEISYPDNS
ncbi:MAG: hypothetical protein ACK5LC_09795, partial [Coprobacillaceae bacterium]